MKKLQVGLTEKENLQIIISDDRSIKCSVNGFDRSIFTDSAKKEEVKASIGHLITLTNASSQELVPRDMIALFYDGDYEESINSVSFYKMIEGIQESIYKYYIQNENGNVLVTIGYDKDNYEINLVFTGILYGEENINLLITLNYVFLDYAINYKRILFDYEFRSVATRYIQKRKNTDEKAIALKKFVFSDEQYSLFREEVIKSIINTRDNVNFSWNRKDK